MRILRSIFLAGALSGLVVTGAHAQQSPRDPIAATIGAADDITTGAIPATVPRPRPAAPTPAAAEGTDLAHMIGQMILIGFPGSNPAGDWTRRVAAMLSAGRIGGVVLFSDNVRDPTQLRRLTAALPPSSDGLAPFICVDQEGGAIRRLTTRKGFAGLPSAAQISTMGTEKAFAYYSRSAQEMSRLGINVNFGPVLDLNVNPKNPAIGRLGRSYGTDAATVEAYGRAFVRAHEQAAVLTAAKHFPGHGSAVRDPHEEVIDVSRTWKEGELAPFAALIGDVDMVMVGHLVSPRFSDDTLPASLSQRAIEGLLRGKLGFRGLVVTDDLDMGAIRKRFGVPEAAVMAVAAGADLLIVANHKNPDPEIADRIVTAIMRAVQQGRIRPETIQAAYDRIVRAKLKLADRRAYVMQ